MNLGRLGFKSTFFGQRCRLPRIITAGTNDSKGSAFFGGGVGAQSSYATVLPRHLVRCLAKTCATVRPSSTSIVPQRSLTGTISDLGFFVPDEPPCLIVVRALDFPSLLRCNTVSCGFRPIFNPPTRLQLSVPP